MLRRRPVLRAAGLRVDRPSGMDRSPEHAQRGHARRARRAQRGSTREGPTAPSTQAKHWTVDEARQFLESARTHDDPLYAGYVLMLVLGLRRGGELVRRTTKTHSSDAPLPLPDICIQALAHRRKTETRLRLAAGEAWNPTGLVLTTRFGDPIDPRNFQRAFRSSVRRAGFR